MLTSCYTFWFTISNELCWLPEYATDQAERSNLFETSRTLTRRILVFQDLVVL